MRKYIKKENPGETTWRENKYMVKQAWERKEERVENVRRNKKRNHED